MRRGKAALVLALATLLGSAVAMVVLLDGRSLRFGVGDAVESGPAVEEATVDASRESDAIREERARRARLRRERSASGDPDGWSDEPADADPEAGTAGGRGRERLGPDQAGPTQAQQQAPQDWDAHTLAALLDLDPVTAEPVVAEAGESREMRLGAFVDSGPESVEEVVELVGERRPVLEKGVPVALTGRVVEQGTGEPVAGATVILTSTFYVRGIQYDHHLREVARAVTDAEGEYAVKRLDADPVHFGGGGKVHVTVTAPGHAPVRLKALSGVSSGFRNRLPQVALSQDVHVLEGRITDMWEHLPVAGARIVATGAVDPISYPKDQREALFLGAPQTTTDEDGRFRLEDLGPGLQMISVHGGDDCVGRMAVNVPAQSVVAFETRAIRGRIEGRILDAYDRPVPLVMVDGGLNTTHSFADGGFVLENFRGDTVTLRLAHQDYAPLVLSGIADGSRDLILRLESRWPEVRFDVRHLDTDEPIRRVSVQVEFAGDARPPLPASPFYLSEEGVHAVRIPAGAITVKIDAPGMQQAEVDAAGRVDGETVRVLLRARP